MATTVSFNASMRTRKSNSSSNSKSSQACQEFYTSGYNYVGILHFSGLNLQNKVITAVSLTVYSEKAGYGAGHTKTVYLRKSYHQEASASGVIGRDYCAEPLGTFTGSFYRNTTTTAFTGSLLTNVASYLAAGNNTFCIYNPSPTASSQGYSNNYLMWSTATLSVTYEEGVSSPSTSASSVALGSSVTINTNRLSSSATHTLTYTFGSASGTIATNVGASTSWTPPLSLASQIPSATSGYCTITCNTYVSGSLTGTSYCSVLLTVPASVVPTISNLTYAEAVSGIAAQFGGYVKLRSKQQVTIGASGSYGSSISSYRTSVNGTAYTSSSFTTGTLSTAGSNTISVTVTDSRSRTATKSATFTVIDYARPSITDFHAERCNADGSAVQVDGTKVRISAKGSVSSVSSKNTISCKVFYKQTSSTAWASAGTVTASGYTIAPTNLLLSPTFAALNSYDLKIQLADFFETVEQNISIGTKQVMMDFYKDGSGMAFGKVAEQSGKVEFGWPLILSSALGIQYGGTGATTAAGAIANLGGVKKTGDTMTGNLSIQTSLYPSVYLLPTYNDTTNRTVFEGSYLGASSFAAWEDSSGNNRRMLEVRTAAYASSMDNAVLLRTAVNGTWSAYRLFHAGMATGVPVANGGTGATTAANARSNLGCNNASNLTAGTVPMARMPFKVAYGSTSVSGSSAASINYSSAGFTSVPCVTVIYSTTSSNWSGDNGALKVHSKTTTGATIIVGGSFNTKRNIDWIAIGT